MLFEKQAEQAGLMYSLPSDMTKIT